MKRCRKQYNFPSRSHLASDPYPAGPQGLWPVFSSYYFQLFGRRHSMQGPFRYRSLAWKRATGGPENKNKRRFLNQALGTILSICEIHAQTRARLDVEPYHRSGYDYTVGSAGGTEVTVLRKDYLKSSFLFCTKSYTFIPLARAISESAESAVISRSHFLPNSRIKASVRPTWMK